MVSSDSNPHRGQLQAWGYWSCPLSTQGCSVFMVALAMHRYNSCTQRRLHFALLIQASHQLDQILSALAVLFPSSLNRKIELKASSFPPPSWKRWGQVLWLWPATFSQLFCVKLCSSHHRAHKHTQTWRFHHRALYSCCREEEGASEQGAREQEIKHS